MGFFDVPSVERKPWGYICAISNLLPGIGTLVMAGRSGSVKQYVFGMVQFLLFWTLICWVWSLVWGVLIFLKSEDMAPAPEPTARATKGRPKKAA
jgi:hypothetical protein